jgi:hypothetical protein
VLISSAYLKGFPSFTTQSPELSNKRIIRLFTRTPHKLLRQAATRIGKAINFLRKSEYSKVPEPFEESIISGCQSSRL